MVAGNFLNNLVHSEMQLSTLIPNICSFSATDIGEQNSFNVDRKRRWHASNGGAVDREAA